MDEREREAIIFAQLWMQNLHGSCCWINKNFCVNPSETPDQEETRQEASSTIIPFSSLTTVTIRKSQPEAPPTKSKPDDVSQFVFDAGRLVGDFVKRFSSFSGFIEYSNVFLIKFRHFRVCTVLSLRRSPLLRGSFF